MGDVVERLRKYGNEHALDLGHDAADEIERLRQLALDLDAQLIARTDSLILRDTENERLRAENAELMVYNHKIGCQVWDSDHAARQEIERLRAENAALHERMEDNHAFEIRDGVMTRVDVEPGSIPDGIDCRDETIKGLTEQVERLREEKDYHRHQAVCAVATAEKRQAEIERLRAENAEVRKILASTDIASLPDDYPLPRMATDRMEERDKFKWQVIDTCKRAEKAEAEIERLQAEVAFSDAERHRLEDGIGTALRNGKENAARSMRERNVAAIRNSGMDDQAKAHAIAAIRDMPLIEEPK